VGCDDPFLKMTGEGNRMALPIWGYFFSKAYSDQSLGLQQEADFIQPASMKTEVTMDYEDFAEKSRNEADAENENAGSGNSEDFFIEGEGGNDNGTDMLENEIIEEAKKDKKQIPQNKKEIPKQEIQEPEKKTLNKKPAGGK
jgi:penicillin-binding protein 1A